MDAEAVWQLLLAERARHAAELEDRDRKLAAQDDARASDHELIERLTRIIRDLLRISVIVGGCFSRWWALISSDRGQVLA